MPGRLLAFALLALTTACVGGPDSCFLPPSIVDAPRLLALRSDPPDQVVDLAGATGPSVTARALFGGQSSGASLRLGGKLCAPTSDLRCPATALEVPEGPVSPFDSPEASTGFEVPLSLLLSAREADPLKGHGGIRVLFDARAWVGGQELHAGKLLLFQTKESGVPPNGGIELDGVELLQRDGGVQSTTSRPPRLTVGAVYGLHPLLRAGDGAAEPLEQYEVTDLAGRHVSLRERVSYSFFTTAELIFGDLEWLAGNPVARYVPGADVADEPPPGSTPPANGLVRLTALTKKATWLWVVARDGRGAVAWTRSAIQVVDAREGRKPDLRPVCDEITR